MPSSRAALFFIFAIVAALVLAACGDDDAPATPTPDAGRDATPDTDDGEDTLPDTDDQDVPEDDVALDVSEDDAASDSSEDVPLDLGPRPDPGTPVEVDLAELTSDPPDPEGTVRVFQSQSEDDLVGGPAAQGRVGDYILENDRVRFVIESDTRAIGPCPYGGNVIDADVRRPEGEPGQDVVGEICLFLFVGQTLDPDSYEIVADGSEGYGVLAVTGHLEILDFINVPGIASGFLPGIEIPIYIETDSDKDITVTIYYVMRPGDQGVHVVVGVRNDGDRLYELPFVQLIDSGGNVDFFNPASTRRGFGYVGLGADSINGEDMMLLGFRGDNSSHTFVAPPYDQPDSDLPVGGAYIAVSGVAVPMIGTDKLLDTLIAPPSQIAQMDHVIHLAPADVVVREYWHLAGDGSMSTTVDFALPYLGLEAGTLTGTVTDPGDAPVDGALVAAIDGEGRTLNHAKSDAEGHFSMDLPPGTYDVRASAPGRTLSASESVTLAVDDTRDIALTVGTTGTLHVAITDPGGNPTPGKVTVSCVGECPIQLTTNDRDINFDGLPGSVANIEFVGVSGEVDIPLAPADYRVAVTRGYAWSVWPPTATVDRGQLITIEADATVELAAEIAEVVDLTSVVSGDLHVHGINSPDSTIAEVERVENFMAEGLDVLVSTDHDYITDYAPTITELGAEGFLNSVIGQEITTFDYGHYNAFPLERDDEARNGGAIDWAGGPDVGLTPAEIFETAKAYPGDQVVQVNHPASGYWIASSADPLRGLSLTDPTKFRLPATEPDPVTGDTGLWDEGFTAFEVLNGHGRSDFWALARWWMVLVGRGFKPTATAVSDTHKRIKSQAGGPRSYVFVGDAYDSPATFEVQPFVQAINAGKLVGSSGPLFRVSVVNDEGVSAGLGEVVSATAGQPVTIALDLDMPTWMKVDTVHVYANLTEGIIPNPGRFDYSPIPPTLTVPVELLESDREVVAEGVETHEHYVKHVEIEYTPTSDTYVIVLIEGAGDGIGSMFPVHHGGTRPFAFSNPVYIDTDGGGYDNPPLADLVSSEKRARPNTLPPGPLRIEPREAVQRLLDALSAHH